MSCKAAPTALAFTRNKTLGWLPLPRRQPSSGSITSPALVTHHHLLIDLNNLVSWQDLGARGSLV